MKKLTFLIIALIAVQFMGCKKGEQTFVQNDGHVNFTAGEVSGISDGKTISINVGDVITQGMTVKTGVKSMVEISFQGSNIRIKEKSSVVMKELVKNYTEDKELTELNVENGQVLLKVTRKLTSGEKFVVNTPTSVAGVRGTEFHVNAEENKSTISCVEGKVAVKESSSDDSAFVMVEAGKEAVVEKGKAVIIRNINEDVKDRNNRVTVQKETTVKKKIEQGVKQKETVIQDIKGAAMIRAEAVKGDIEGKKE